MTLPAPPQQEPAPEPSLPKGPSAPAAAIPAATLPPAAPPAPPPGPLPGALRQVLAPNPSPMTGPGTTTFLLGRGEVLAIDPGPDLPGHLAAILAALGPQERLTTILVTHPHLDHSALAPRLAAATGAEVLGFGPAGAGRSATMAALAAAGLPGGSEGVDTAFRPHRRLTGGERLDLAGAPLEVIHTPGHMAEHLCLAWGDVLFTGDHVMGWAPSLVSPPDGDMADYLASLDRLAARRWRLMLPAHGAAISDPAARLAELSAHRRQRAGQILAALAAGPAPLEALTARVYRDTDPRLLPAAARNTLAHLIDLIAAGRVTASPWPSAAALFSLAAPG